MSARTASNTDKLRPDTKFDLDGPDGIVITMVTPTVDKNDEEGCLAIMAKMVANTGCGRLNVIAATVDQ
ncbi:hypothetical protein B9Z55_023309 [Caenorhabditis nigoni]|uniref:Uncharacterized protein n=1 Tax=Caenorhabditis nigoni TaxID=1611254 RepID=A0A2G5SPA8_9PELO|nr:hypothetical protein B9Z55_023309 [Caenorhabditis nigoni]